MSIRNAHSRARAAGTAALLLLPFAAAAQTTNIIRPIAAGQTDLMSVPLVAVGGNAISNMFADAPDGSVIYLWDLDLQNWIPSQKSSKDWPGSSRELQPGEAFLFKPSGAYTVVLRGTPPDPPIARPVSGDGRASLLGYFYPVDIHWTDTQLATLLPPGSMVSFWNRTNAYFQTTFLKAPAAKGGGWGNTASNYIIRAGDGFAAWQSGPDFNWSE